MSPTVLLSCGEPSGDLYAAALTRELRRLIPDVAIAGLGGPEFVEAGGELLVDYRGVAVTGLTEALPKIPRSLAAVWRLTAMARETRPEALVVIDFPDFNFRLAQRIKRLGVPVVYYISPQLWAWRPGRMKTIRRIADRVLVIFPFEEELYRRAGVPVEFVGHPLMDLTAEAPPRDAFLRGVGLDPEAPTVALLPGSRVNEVSRILPVLLESCDRIRAQVPGVQFVIARAPNLDDRLFAGVSGRQYGIALVERHADAVLACADVTVTASGTATVQAAVHGTPMVVVYKLSPLTYRLGRRLVLLDTFAMANLIAGERIVPELIQDDCTPESVTRETVSLLTDPARAARMREGLARVRALLGGPGASRRAAQAVVKVMKREM